jgi:hypothetical protein
MVTSGAGTYRCPSSVHRARSARPSSIDDKMEIVFGKKSSRGPTKISAGDACKGLRLTDLLRPDTRLQTP